MGIAAKYLSSIIVKLLQIWILNITRCVGQSHNNSSNIADKYTGVQAQIKNFTLTADVVPCATHSLNLVDINLIESCIQTVNFFGLIQAVYEFFLFR